MASHMYHPLHSQGFFPSHPISFLSHTAINHLSLLRYLSIAIYSSVSLQTKNAIHHYPEKKKNKSLCLLLDYIQIIQSIIILLSNLVIFIFHYHHNHYHNFLSKYNNAQQQLSPCKVILSNDVLQHDLSQHGFPESDIASFFKYPGLLYHKIEN